MSLFLNELSLHGQFLYSYEFSAALKLVMRSRLEAEKRKKQIYCCDRLRIAAITPTTNFMEEVNLLENREQRISIIRWFAESNWSVDQMHSSDEFFWFDHQLITERTIAEVAFRVACDETCALISFAPSDFAITPLQITWQRDDETTSVIPVDNAWTYEGTIALLDKWETEELNRPIQTWGQLIAWAQRFCPRLTFADYLLDALRGVPFSHSVASQVQRRLTVLNTIVNVDANGQRSKEGQLAYENHFLGDRAWFTDESETNKRMFETELSFPSPADATQRIPCPWHGKISTNYFRIHFNWPLDQPTDPLYIVHIGPKITKK